MEESSQSSGEERSYSSSSDEQQPKRRKAKETLKQDLISTMPDSILLHILSLLPTKYAVRTGTLSHRWLYLWTSVPNLNFNSGFYPESKFASFVDQTLIFHKCCKVKKFILEFEREVTSAPRVDTWVRFATRANVEELCLDLSSEAGYQYVLPQHVYSNSSIMKLRLSQCEVAPNGLIRWKSLKSLSLGNTGVSEDVIQKVLVGSPVLESLELYEFWGFNRLDIGSATLRKLVLRDHRDSTSDEDYSTLKISAPNLQSLDILREMCWWELKLVNIQSLVDCNLNFKQATYYQDTNDDYEGNVMGELLNRLHHVKNLTLGNWCIRVLSKLELKGMLPPLFKCKCLILHVDIQKYVVPGIVDLVQSSPNLETLIINMKVGPYNPKYGFYKNFVENHWNFVENYWTSQKRSSKCSPLLLKTVKIVFSPDQYFGIELVIPLVQFLLEKARVLEKIVIDERRSCFGKKSPKESVQAAQKLLSLPRSSPHAVVMFFSEVIERFFE